MLNKVRIDKKYNWHHLKYHQNNIYVKTNIANIEKISFFFKKQEKINLKIFKNFITTLDFYFGIILENKKNVFCAVDNVRSQPIFFNNKGYVSNSAKLLKNDNFVNKRSVLEFKMLGYVSGNETLINNVYQINSGNIIRWKKKNNIKKKIKYFEYLPNYSKKQSYNKFELIINKIFKKIIKRANGKTIIVFLSGGLDSRFILGKLVELKYNKILAVSYGIKRNHESIKAKEISQLLNVPWKFYEHDEKKINFLYKSYERKNYSDYSSNLSSTPSYLEFETLSKMNKENFLKNKIVINGQSGDYISGSHLTKFINYSKKSKIKNLYEYIIKKHYSLWKNLVNKKNISFIKKKINKSFGKLVIKKKNLKMLYEYWEWKERQSKLVVNGNKAYDFFNVEWEMPLWDKEIMKFFEKIPLKDKINQNFYINFLKKKNYRNIFNDLRSEPEVWVGIYKIIKFVGFFLNFIPVKDIKEKFYKRMYYYSNDKNQYGMLGKEIFLKNYKKSRNTVSFFSKYYLEENNLK
tara:strand:+ start:4717 stop:6276 length:1560 start_codon:yes stop_codon:yes gene_type:complete